VILKTPRLSAAVLALAMLVAPLAQAQPVPGDDDLAAKATDPTAALMSFQLNDAYTANTHGTDNSANQINVRAAIPFELGSTQHIFRVIQPYATSSAAGSGLLDTTVFDLMVFDQSWGRWGVGVSGTLPTGSDGLTTNKWTAGPALGFVSSAQKQYSWGLFAQTFFSFAGKDTASDIGLVNLQPIFSYPLGKGRSLSLGIIAFVSDTERSRWTSLLASVSYGQVVGFAGHKWRPNAELGYDFKDDPGNPKWVIRAGITLLLPR